MLVIISIICILALIISFFWIRGIDYMNENYPDYKGEDFFNEEDKNEIL